MIPTIPELSAQECSEYNAFKIRMTGLIDIFGPFKTSVWITGSATNTPERKLYLRVSKDKEILYEAWELIDNYFSKDAMSVAIKILENGFIHGSVRYFLARMAEYSELQRQVFKHNQITSR